jgi:hypothetical protein
MRATAPRCRWAPSDSSAAIIPPGEHTIYMRRIVKGRAHRLRQSWCFLARVLLGCAVAGMFAGAAAADSIVAAAGGKFINLQFDSERLGRSGSNVAVIPGDFGRFFGTDFKPISIFIHAPRTVFPSVEGTPPDPPETDGGSATPTPSTVTPSPEPPSISLVLLGTVFLIGLEWKRF